MEPALHLAADDWLTPGQNSLDEDVADMIFSGMLGASVMYGMDRSIGNLNRTIKSLIEYLGTLAVQKS